MMDNIRFPEFLASLESTTYPFVPTASLSNGKVGFLEGTFLDAHLYSVASTGRCYISQVTVQSDRFTIYIGDSNDAKLLSVTETIPLTNGVLQLQDARGRSGGVLVSEPVRLAVLSAWGSGIHLFERSQTEFCVTCQMPVPDPGVTGLRLETGEILSGRVWLVGGEGVVLRTEEVPNGRGGTELRLRIDASGDPLFREKACADNPSYTPVIPIEYIQVKCGETEYACTPYPSCNFNIQMNSANTPDAALRVRTTSKGIVMQVEGSTS